MMGGSNRHMYISNYNILRSSNALHTHTLGTQQNGIIYFNLYDISYAKHKRYFEKGW